MILFLHISYRLVDVVEVLGCLGQALACILLDTEVAAVPSLHTVYINGARLYFSALSSNVRFTAVIVTA